MSVIENTKSNTITYFEQAMRTQLKTQESEMREQLKTQETEMRAEKVKNTTNNRIVEELRPLCEELPPDALDPVTMEPFEIPVVYRCGHIFDKATVKSLISQIGPLWNGDLDCPVCKLTTGRIQLLQCIPLEGLVEHLQKIEKIFKEHTENEPT